MARPPSGSPRLRHYLREWRKHRRLTQMQLVELSGRSQSAITEYENGRKNMSMDAQADLARALGIQPFQLLQPPPGEDRAPLSKPQEPASIDDMLADADDATREKVAAIVRLLIGPNDPQR